MTTNSKDKNETSGLEKKGDMLPANVIGPTVKRLARRLNACPN